MSQLKLNDKQAVLRDELRRAVADIRRLGESRAPQDQPKIDEVTSDMAKKAHDLHMQLKKAGTEPVHHRYMVQNRGVRPDTLEFYEHEDAVEDLLSFLEDSTANQDPVDLTLEHEFTFAVYSRRWGHDDTYYVKRTRTGWYISHLRIKGPCDKAGVPYLFRNLEQDHIEYPLQLGNRLEWLWTQAQEQGLAHETVQACLNQLAAWVNTTEREAPSGDIWDEYK